MSDYDHSEHPADPYNNRFPCDPKMERIGRELIEAVGEDPTREGLVATPERFSRSWGYLTSGYGVDIHELIHDAVFNEAYKEIVLLKRIPFASLCEHHLLPFYGTCSVAYIPDGRLIGLSKIPRIVDVFARRLQIQERLTVQIAECLNQHLEPKGVAVVIEAFHLCMAIRGVEKQGARTTTSEMTGIFRSDPRSRSEVLNLFGMNLVD